MRDSNSSEAISESSDHSESWDRVGGKHEERLLPLKEDLADWLNKTLDETRITAANLMDVLDSGVLVCRLAKLIHDRAVVCDPAMVPPFNFKWWSNAQPASFFARDNTANFIGWCRQFGINEAVLFESESLVLHTQPRTVVLCLLELARFASKYNIEPPGIVKLENDIDEKEDCVRVGEQLKGGENEKKRYDAPSTSSSLSQLSELDDDSSKLHSKVLHIADVHCSRSHVQRISDGKYLIAGRIVYVRLLNDRHVMVRVGGGWDTLEHFVARHRRSSLQSGVPEMSGGERPQMIEMVCSSATTPSSTIGVVIL